MAQVSAAKTSGLSRMVKIFEALITERFAMTDSLREKRQHYPPDC